MPVPRVIDTDGSVVRCIPCYENGAMVGYRTPEAARALVKRGVADLIINRKGYIRAIFIRPTGELPTVIQQPPLPNRYSFLQGLEDGHQVWTLKKLGKGDELRPAFVQVVTDCLVTP